MILVTFFLHIFGQTLAHALMLVAVGAKIAWDTRNYGSTSRLPVFAGTTPTGHLWYMMAAT